MSVIDLKLIETGNGGDFVNLGNDLAVTSSISTMIYLALFGGNVEESTEVGSVKLQSFDCWMNKLLMADEPSQWFNSLTERTLNTVSLTSEGRTEIEEAVKEDLKFLSSIYKITVEVTYPKLNYVRITFNIQQIESTNEGVMVINLRKENGDFSILDFDFSDFLI